MVDNGFSQAYNAPIKAKASLRSDLMDALAFLFFRSVLPPAPAGRRAPGAFGGEGRGSGEHQSFERVKKNGVHTGVFWKRSL